MTGFDWWTVIAVTFLLLVGIGRRLGGPGPRPGLFD